MHCAAVVHSIGPLTFLGLFSNSTVSSYVETSIDHDGQQRGHLLSNLSIPLHVHPYHSG